MALKDEKSAGVLVKEKSINKDQSVSTVKNYINGKWVLSIGTETVDVINPANKKIIGRCPLGNSQDVDNAVKAAKEAFKTWREVPTIDRVQILFRLKSLLEKNLEDLAKLCTEENGKILIESRGDVRRGIQMIETACGMPTLIMGKSFEDVASGIDCHAVRRPLGVFGAITPFNFPPMVPFWFWPFAVACGNTFILKPSERVPLTQSRVFELVEEAGMPKGVLNLVNGSKEVVNTLCKHPDIKGISFVGSTPVAKHVYETACSHGKRVQALGGAKNFMVVLPDAVMEQAAKTVFESCTGCAGQRCLAGSVILGVGDASHIIEKEIVKLANQAKVGNGLDPSSNIGPLISEDARKRVKGLIQSAIDEGAKVLVDGREGIENLDGYFLKPTVISEVKQNMKIAKEEIFGPVICLGKVESFDEAIKWLNSSEYGNTASLFTTNGAAARKFSYEVEPSMIGINIGVPAPMAFFSFGGSKASFFGDIKAHGQASIDFYTDTKVTIQRWVKNSSIW
ncbi:MAG: CoA-acylating methylmalonate-semialdehyde dehydrogenase [Candidatus Melainabacteria bacterium]|nr:CoA-acylating methylmalonate-semialdehyde dehydrogenase [Candidatus Melainabacteria bacterium]